MFYENYKKFTWHVRVMLSIVEIFQNINTGGRHHVCMSLNSTKRKLETFNSYRV